MIEQFSLYLGDCRDVMRTLAENSVDAIVTDPPYELTSARPGGRSEATRGKVMGGFMGMKWDGTGVAFDPETWAEALRVLKPGGYLLAFSGTRTYHRMVCAIEDAGFEVRDQIGWAFGSGFPKSHNGLWGGTALKPAWEPLCMARKPLAGTVEANWRAYGTGALNIDGCRVEGIVTTNPQSRGAGNISTNGHKGQDETGLSRVSDVGRWPANLIHDGSDEVLAAFPQAKGQQGATAERVQGAVYGAVNGGVAGLEPRGDTGSAARFFYCAKASKTDRSAGLDDFTPTTTDGRFVAADNAYQRGKTERANNHPTVKPTELMRYLCRLVTPPGGLVLDPFMGSGSTGKAAVLEGFRFVGCELSGDYLAIARARITHALIGDLL